MKWLRLVTILNLIFVALLAVACSPDSEPGATDGLIIPTDTPALDALAPATEAAPGAGEAEAESLPPAPTVVIDPTAVVDPTPTPGPLAPPDYFVINVAGDDVLNVRSGPGIESEIVAELPPDAAGIDIVGAGRLFEEFTWVPIRTPDGVEGWVNRVFLAQTLDGEAFCADDSGLDLADSFRAAVAAQDGDALAALVDPERGLRIHMHWTHTPVRIRGDALADLFAADTVYEWGTEPGSGLEISGSFSDVVQPLLTRDLLPAGEVACNEILHGGTPGLIVLPEGHAGLNYYSFFRPDQEGSATYPLDWGTWVVGVEAWEGRLVISFLVHYRWEI